MTTIKKTQFPLYYFIIVSLLIFLDYFSIQTVSCLGQEETEVTQNIIYLEKNRHGMPLALRTPIIHFSGRNEKNEPIAVDLIGAIHFADPSYYARLNNFFTEYESVLVEMVLPEGMKLSDISSERPQRDRSPKSLLDFFSVLQDESGKFLGLVSQTEAINYRAPNMLLADIDAKRLAELFADNREMERLIADLILEFFEDPADMGEESLLLPGLILLSRDRRLTLRRCLAAKIVESGFDSPFFDKTLILERNRVALEKLADQIAAGDHRIAIFYGAAHLTDLSERLTADFGMTEVGRDWITAWSLKKE